jgi:hypothetical protein
MGGEEDAISEIALHLGNDILFRCQMRLIIGAPAHIPNPGKR